MEMPLLQLWNGDDYKEMEAEVRPPPTSVAYTN